MTGRIRKALSLSAAALLASNSFAIAQGYQPAKPLAPLPIEDIQRDVLTVGQKMSIRLPAPIGAAFTDEKVANIIPVTPTQIEVVAVGPGQTDVKLYDTAGRPMLTQAIKVQPDFGDLTRLLSTGVPGSQIELDSLQGKIVLNGTAPTNLAIDRAVQLASAAAGGRDNVINLLSSRGNDLVYLKIEVVEVARESIKQLGFNTQALFGQLGVDQWGVGNAPIYSVNSGYQGGFSGGWARNTTSQPVGTAANSLFGNLVGIPFGNTGITNATIGQTIDAFMRGGTPLTAEQANWARNYLAQYAGQVQVVDAASNATYTMADIGINMANLPAQIQAYYSNSSALTGHGNEWIRKFLDGLPDFNNNYYSFTANPNSTFIDRNNPANPVATNRVGAPGLNQGSSMIQAFERVGLTRVISEPNGTGISGKKFETHVGGTLYLPSGADRDGNLTLQEKDYGVQMSFTPVVLSDGNISLEINAEVSDVSTAYSTTLNTSPGPVSIPSIDTRKASSTVEMPAGGSIVIAGLVRDINREAVDKTPGLADLPGIGALLRSRDYRGGQTDLVIIATVALVHPVGRDSLQTPADGLQIATDLSTILVGRLNRTYSRPEAVEGRTYEGPFGHVIE